MLRFRTGEQRHLVPLLDFITFLCLQGKHRTQRFPRRYNGVAGFGPASLARSYEIVGGDESSSESNEVDAGVDLYSCKRPRNDVQDGIKHINGPETPHGEGEGSMMPTFVEHIKKGVVLAKFVDVSLTQYGMQLLFDYKAAHPDRKAMRCLLARPCCYVEANTYAIITGRVIDVDVKGLLVQVCPDRGVSADLEWVSLEHAYCITDDLERIQEQIRSDVADLTRR